MAIDYFGHTDRDDANTLLAQARAAHPEWFDTILLLYDARPFKYPFEAEISREFGIAATRTFMLSVNDKEAFWEVIEDALDYLYGLFGTERLAITHGFDSVRPPPAA
ncbi:MAG TPA: hypothetical protein VG889_08965 [Rhizomicrobium sp.]|nr:hypothetical protein [Rhizomicrobium sp.]